MKFELDINCTKNFFCERLAQLEERSNRILFFFGDIEDSPKSSLFIKKRVQDSYKLYYTRPLSIFPFGKYLNHQLTMKIVANQDKICIRGKITIKPFLLLMLMFFALIITLQYNFIKIEGSFDVIYISIPIIVLIYLVVSKKIFIERMKSLLIDIAKSKN